MSLVDNILASQATKAGTVGTAPEPKKSLVDQINTPVQQEVASGQAAELQPIVSSAPAAQPLTVSELPVIPRHEVPGTQEAEPVVADPTPVAASKEPQPEEPEMEVADMVWAPNVISLSDDDERNRTFGLSYSSPVSDFKVYIYNRGGRQVYSSTDADFRWDGSMNGTQLPQGAYVWVAQFRDSEGRAVQRKGTVTLLR